MKIKYIVKSELQPNLYLVEDVDLGNRKVPYAFKPCGQIRYEVAEFDNREDALVACNEANTYQRISHYVPVILEIVAE